MARSCKKLETSNYALAMLTKKKYTNGNSSIECLESAKVLLKRFEFTLDNACLTECLERIVTFIGKPISVLNDDSLRFSKFTSQKISPCLVVCSNLVEYNKMRMYLHE